MKSRRTPLLVLPLVLCSAVAALLLLLGDAFADSSSTVRYVAQGGDCGAASPCYPTIQDAVDAAGNGDTIKVAQGVYTDTGLSVVYINRAIRVIGGYTVTNWAKSLPSTQATVIDAEDVARRRGILIQGTSAATTTIQALTVIGGKATDAAAGGGAIYANSGNVALENLRILDSWASGSGGGIHLGSGQYILSDIVVQGNQASAGGGIYLEGGLHTIRDSLVQGNQATNSGGVIHLESGRRAFRDTSVQNSQASRYGGGIYMHRGRLSLSGSTFSGNSAAEGCGLHATGYERLTVADSTFIENLGCGGWGLYAAGQPNSQTHLYDNTFRHNQNGGARVHWYENTFPIGQSLFASGNLFQDNTGAECGGLDVAVASVSLVDNVFSGNSGSDGGGLCVGAGSGTLQANRFENNSARDDGGGLSAYLGTGVLSSNIFTNNSAGNRGGGIRLGGGDDVVLRGNVIYSNTAGTAGGGLATEAEHATGINDVIAANTSPFEGVYVYGGGSLSAYHWTLADNGSYALTTDGGSATLTNTIVSTHSIGGLAGLNIKADHSLFFNSNNPCSSGAACTNVLAGDPHFIDPLSGDYHIDARSAALDAGIDSGIDIDIDGDARPKGSGYDIGADELVVGPFLAVTKIATPDPVQPGVRLTYTLYVTNTGTVSLTATITDLLPAHVRPSGTITWQLPQLLPTQVWSETVLVTVETGYLGPLTNTVQVSSQEGATGSYTHTVLSMKGIYLPVMFRGGS